MSYLSIDINKNHIFFLLIFISYMLREFWLEAIDSYKQFKDYRFGNSKKATKKFFNLYIYTLGNYFSFFCIYIIKLNTRHKSHENENSTSEIQLSASSSTIDYIYTNDLPINERKLLIRTLMVSIFDWIAQYFYIVFDVAVNDDQKGDIKERLDFICIINILSTYLFSMMILKTCYYRHHYLSTIISLSCLIVLSVFNLIEIPQYDKYVIINLFIRIFSQISYSLEDVIGKKALIQEFLSPYSLLLYKGIYELVILLLSSIPFFLIKRDDAIIFSKLVLLINSPLKVLLFFILMILNFIYTLFIWTIIDRFSPNDYALTMIFEGIFDKILILVKGIKFEKKLFILSIIIYLILIITICIHSEIIIINACDLNKYTKKIIGKKGEEDYELSFKTDRANSIDSFNEENNVKKKTNYRLSTHINYDKKDNEELNKNKRKTFYNRFKINDLNDDEDEDDTN